MLRVEDLHKRYGAVVALDGFSLELARGEAVVIMGPSGCGKSTAIRCINRLTEPDRGRVWLGDVEVTALDHRDLLHLRRRIGFVFQHFNLIGRLTALENVALPLILQEVPREEAFKRARAALGRVGLADALERRPQELSGGQRQRVGIARALATQPELMLWDEPTASLDPILVREVLDVMEELIRSGETTMLIVTHEVGFARRAANRLVLMEAGRVVEQGDPQEVLTSPRSSIGRAYRRMLAA